MEILKFIDISIGVGPVARFGRLGCLPHLDSLVIGFTNKGHVAIWRRGARRLATRFGASNRDIITVL